MPIYVFKCKVGHTTEAIVPYDTKSRKCEVCGKRAKREGVEAPARRNPAYGIQRNNLGL